MKKETIADLCDKLRKSGELDCLSIAHEWGPNCVNVSDCDACQKAVYDSIADRIEVAHQREIAEACDLHLLGGDMQSDLVNLGKPCGDGDAVLDASTIRTAEDAEDTREKVEGSLVHLILGICAARLRTDKTNMELVARFKNEFIRILDRQEAITERNCRAEYDDMREYLQTQVDGLEAKVYELESENDRLKVKVSNQRKELDIHQTMYDVEAVAQLKREKKRYKGMYNAEHQRACSQRRKIDRLTEENEAMRQALMDLGDILG